MVTEKKYKLTDECITVIIDGRKLYRIEALKDFGNVHKGDKGGFVESEDNLSQYGDCWIYYEARVYGNAKVYNNAKVFDNAEVYGDARVHNNVCICGDARVSGYANVFGDAWVYGKANVYGNAIVNDKANVWGEASICGNAKIASKSDYIVFKNWWSNDIYFTWTRSNNMWKANYFYGTGKELIAKAYKDSELSGREYKRVVKYVESILKDSKL